MKIRTFALASLLLAAVGAAHAQTGKALYDAVCAGCHAAGVIGAPKPGDAEAWKPRLAKGKDILVRNAILGTNKGMPPKGGREDLSRRADPLRGRVHDRRTAGARCREG